MKKLCAISTIFVLLTSILCNNFVFAKQETENTRLHYTKVSTKTSTIKAVKESKEETANINITSKSAVLIEGSTGEIIFEKNKDEKLKPASITKIMTLLLIFEALDSGKIKLEDQVPVSEHAASMGGSQVWLEPNETLTVNDMIKCISIVSANDACVAMAEYIAGSEEEFVARMNEKAKELGMQNTHFVNCCGLDVDNHYSTAYDVALMSRELVTKHPDIQNYCTVWMDSITHVTKKGESTFGLSNTNKLIKTYNGITGLKTGSTSLAKYCLSATAKRDGMDLIAVIMAAPSTKDRFHEAARLLDYGFANCSLYSDSSVNDNLGSVTVNKGIKDKVEAKASQIFHYICLKNTKKEDIKKEVELYNNITAPVKENQKIGVIHYFNKDKEIGNVDIVAKETINKATFTHFFGKIILQYLITNEKMN
ncbi:D-alanyl-D-alanine carboxypeptidase family protein [Anaeromicropila herbilytica]|uniref:serine-type D-Ala-D-Ala carboxypeptidase n=1 Tax=Anaeromicropila herbilytica TaxID=2785025 RepID=A0A7R7EML1_9FIRM|nr:D-alanyl-D-alanine carboxypeptidase family protein [Anaeromicropila herbilytica]BCN31396.1 D-alanyl-D-alanine carboxypeptidase [Anaeromicropila herbilytica]